MASHQIEDRLAGSPDGGIDASRRHLLKVVAGLGVGSVVFQRAVVALAEENSGVTTEMIRQAEWIAGLELDEAQRESTAKAVQRSVLNFRELRNVPLDNSVPPAISFHPLSWADMADGGNVGEVSLSEHSAPQRPQSDDVLAFLPVSELAPLVRTRQVSSVELTRLYVDRLRRFDPVLKCVVNDTEELAMQQAERADREIAAGRYRGPLHGIPWGAKDLIAYPGYPTTWGAAPFRDQVIDTKATVAARLEQAGAVLVAKLTLGALAQGDRWFGGQTKSPWNPKIGSSGSSAGPAAATAAGLVGFSLGSETNGSIVSPCRRCGVTGLRPTFGRVSRHGCMALAWSMDKIGPIARSVEDCALILGAIHGSDGLDPTAVDRPFHWPATRDVRALRVGYVEGNKPIDERPELQILREAGVQLTPIELPDRRLAGRVLMILGTEAAAAFDELTRQGITEGLNSWPRTFRQGQFTPAVEYLRANRIRTLLMREMEELFKHVDAYVGGGDLSLTNLTGHPTVVVPNGFRPVGEFHMPSALTFTGKLYGETELLALAHAYQQATDFHLKRPPMDKLLAEVANE